MIQRSHHWRNFGEWLFAVALLPIFLLLSGAFKLYLLAKRIIRSRNVTQRDHL